MARSTFDCMRGNHKHGLLSHAHRIKEMPPPHGGQPDFMLYDLTEEGLGAFVHLAAPNAPLPVSNMRLKAS